MFRRSGLIQSFSSCASVTAASLASKMEWIAGLERSMFKHLSCEVKKIRSERDADFGRFVDEIVE
jgi:hypothetical protein